MYLPNILEILKQSDL